MQEGHNKSCSALVMTSAMLQRFINCPIIIIIVSNINR